MIRPALITLLLVTSLRAATTYVPSNISPPSPEREFRGAWVASVNNIDWPSKPGLSTDDQKRELVALLDKCQQLKLNVVILQVRPACDALYPSQLEPWSEYLTGQQGKAPSPLWDPLEFAVAQAHARGLELHAWFNPFRARHSTGFGPRANSHVSKTRPSWAKPYGAHLWLDPGLREVHDYSARVILDVVNRYDIDGIHIDDYFYPYPEKGRDKKEIPFPDWTSWLNYQKAGGKLTRNDWRRDNVNRFVARIYRDVHAAKPWVKVGISPFGIYRPGYPAQIKGFDQYESLYADPRTWLANGWLDYLAPQLYWRIDPPATSFPVLLKWWTANNPKHKLIVAGMNTTAVGAQNWPASEIVKQIEITRQLSAAGHIHWNMGAVMKNKGGVADELRQVYRQPALAPSLSGAARLPAPRLTGRLTSRGVEFRCEMPNDPSARFFVVQERRSDGRWHTRVDAAKSFTQEQINFPGAISVRALDRFGHLGAAAVLERRDVPARR
ncbi:MAG TPA: family 10 glycosylhydrolase [Methylomirabilota bacterium]|nr:family 10 glycosylhydrolase [Methylomirabilota bacterium]